MKIQWSPITCIHENNPPGTIVCGVPGSGKTYSLLNISANVIEQGARLFALDAKNDLIPLTYLYPDIRLIDVNDIQPGSLDPFLVFGKDIDTTTVLTIVEIICGELNSDQKLAVTPIINDFVLRVQRGVNEGVTLLKFADYLYANQNIHAQSIGNTLKINQNSKYGPLIFGEIGVSSKKLNLENKNTVISILGMALPSGASHPRADEMVNSAIVYIICKMVKELLVKKNKNDKTPTLFVLDECHMLMRSDAITDIIDEFLVLGRSLGLAVLMASQNVTHFPSSIAQLVSTKICFRLSKQESSEFFDMFNNSSKGQELSVQESIDIVTRLKTGYCFMIDSRNRSGIIHITSNFPQESLTSNPLLKKNR